MCIAKRFESKNKNFLILNFGSNVEVIWLENYNRKFKINLN